MEYGYYGAEHQDVSAINEAYPGISTPGELYRALTGVWCLETCSPSLRHMWSPENMTVGQCSITALLAQDIFGGAIYGMDLPGGAVHCYNVAQGRAFDLASEQFGEEAAKLCYEGNRLIDRKDQLSDKGKLERFELLKKRLRESLK